MSYLVLARKYRPKTFEQLVGQSHVVQALTNALRSQRLHHAYLFTGTRGVGKTTVSRILAKSLNCEIGITEQPCGVCAACTDIDAGHFVDYTELDAASNRSVDEIQQLLEQAVYKPVQGRFKVFMIDEVHMLTGHAFNAMLKTLEEPPEYLKFVLATTDPHKVPVTVLSRCLQFNLRPMAAQTIVEHLQYVLRDMLGSVDRSHVFTLIEALANSDGQAVVATCDVMRQMGLSASSLLEEMCMVLQRMAVQQTVPSASDDSSDPDPDAQRIAELAALMPADETQLLYSMCLHGRTELGLASDEFAALTMVLLRLFAFKPASESAEKKTLKSAEARPQTIASSDNTLAEAWFVVVEQLLTGQKIQAMTRELAMQSQCVQRQATRWVLQVERESLVSPANVERLQNALHEAGHSVTLVTQIGDVADSPAIRLAQKQQQRLSDVEEEILNDPVVQQLITEFDAKIVPGSIKTLTH